jgi:hypothetical protein
MVPPTAALRCRLPLGISPQPSITSINLNRRSTDEWSEFNEIPVDPWAGAVDLVHRTVDPVYAFFNRKIIHKFVGILETLYFYRKAPLVYFIYVLVHAILQKQLWTFLKLYFPL